MGPYPKTPFGNRFILVIEDMFTRWVEAFALLITTAQTICAVLETEMFARYGYPKAIITDNGPQFISDHFKYRCKVWGCRSWTTAIITHGQIR